MFPDTLLTSCTACTSSNCLYYTLHCLYCSFDVAKQRYAGDDKEKEGANAQAEQDAWEAEQMKRTRLKASKFCVCTLACACTCMPASRLCCLKCMGSMGLHQCLLSHPFAQAGAADAGAALPQYDFVFEDSIDFIKTAMIAGENDFESAEVGEGVVGGLVGGAVGDPKTPKRCMLDAFVLFPL